MNQRKIFISTTFNVQVMTAPGQEKYPLHSLENSTSKKSSNPYWLLELFNWMIIMHVVRTDWLTDISQFEKSKLWVHVASNICMPLNIWEYHMLQQCLPQALSPMSTIYVRVAKTGVDGIWVLWVSITVLSTYSINAHVNSFESVTVASTNDAPLTAALPSVSRTIRQNKTSTGVSNWIL